MSWSISVIGKPDNVVTELQRYGDTLSGQSKLEFDEAMPNLVGLLQQNFANESPYKTPLIKIDAQGSGSCRPNEKGGSNIQMQRSCTVKIEPFYTTLV